MTSPNLTASDFLAVPTSLNAQTIQGLLGDSKHGVSCQSHSIELMCMHSSCSPALKQVHFDLTGLLSDKKANENSVCGLRGIMGLFDSENAAGPSMDA